MRNIKWFAIVFLVSLISSIAILFQSRVILAVNPQKIIKSEFNQESAILVSINNPNFERTPLKIIDYKIPYSNLYLAYAMVDNLKVNNAEIIKKLIKCESNGENVSRPDSDGIISDGILQYHRSKETPDVLGSGTWDNFSKQSGIKGSPINIQDAIRQTDWAIDHNLIGHWSCYHILKRKGITIEMG